MLSQKGVFASEAAAADALGMKRWLELEHSRGGRIMINWMDQGVKQRWVLGHESLSSSKHLGRTEVQKDAFCCISLPVLGLNL